MFCSQVAHFSQYWSHNISFYLQSYILSILEFSQWMSIITAAIHQHKFCNEGEKYNFIMNIGME